MQQSLEIKAISYISSILKRGLDLTAAEDKKKDPPLLDHQNIRGAGFTHHSKETKMLSHPMDKLRTMKLWGKSAGGADGECQLSFI